MPALTEGELRGLVRSLISQHRQQGDSDSQNRITALRYYRGEPFEDEEDFRSKVVSREVAEAVDSMMPALIKVFASGERVVQFEPFGPEDEDAAEQATDYCNLLWERAGGLRNFHDWFKNALLYRIAAIKTVWEETERVTKERYSNLLPEEVQALLTDPELELDDEADEEPGVVCFRRTTKGGKIGAYVLPPDEFLYDRRAPNEEAGRFFAHRMKRTLSSLIEDGYKRSVVMGLSGDTTAETGQERIERFGVHTYTDENSPPLDPSMREVWVSECYLLVDYDGDGVAEWRMVTVAGEADVILENEEVDEHPFSVLTPVPMPNQMVGRSIFDQTEDLQRIASTLWRQMLDNLYLTNNPEKIVLEGQVNIDDLMQTHPGGLKRVRSMDAIRPMETPFVAQHSFPMLEYIQQVREQRTGVQRFGTDLPANAIDKTATEVAATSESGKQRLELIARIFAETGVKRAFQRILRLVIKHADRQDVVRLRGKWVPIDPRAWNADMDMTVVVGLGTGNKDQQMAHLMAMFQLDAQIIGLQQGAQGPLLTMENIYRKLEKLCEAMGFKTAQGYYTNPADAQMEPQQPKPDPEMLKVQAQIQAAQQKAQAEIQTMQVKAQAQITLAREEAMAQIQLAREKAQAEAQLAVQQQQVEAALAVQQQQAEQQMARDGQRVDSVIRGMTAVRPGGEVG